MKQSVILSLVVCLSLSVAVQAQTIPSGVAFSAGYGFPSFTRTVFNVIDGKNVKSTFIGPLYGKAEIALNETVGFGVDFAYSYGNAAYETSDDEIDTLLYNTSFKYKSYSILARFNFHFGNSEQFDPYAGFGLGYRNANYSYESEDPNFEPGEVNGFNHFGLDFTIGARYFFTDQVGIYGEAGLAKSPFQAGLVVKF